jgi:hypothetical protein
MTQEVKSPLIFLTVAVWGEAFLDLFLEYVLPSYLAAGGIPELPRRGYRAVFWLYTKTSSVPVIEAHKNYLQLANRIESHIVDIDTLVDTTAHQNVYETMNACHQDFIARAAHAQAAMIFYSPDAFWSDQSLRFTLDQIEAGKRAVLLAGLRADKEAVLHELQPLKSELHTVGLTSRTLVGMLLRHPHRITRSLTWDSADFDIGWASHLYWRVSDQGYLGRCFHLHTFFVHPRLEASPEVAHDYDWLEKIGLRPEEICVVQDSDDMFALELSPSDRNVNGRLGVRSWAGLADWTRRYAASDHRVYALRAIYLHSASCWGLPWLRARITSALAIRCILGLAWLQRRFGLQLQPDGYWQNAGLPNQQFSNAWSCLLASIRRWHSS